MIRLTVIIPALNEAQGIQRVVEEIPTRVLSSKGIETEILVVDNGSTDGTGELAMRAGARVVYEDRRGYGRAIKSGIEEAGGDVLLKIDGDSTYPTDRIPEIVELLVRDGLFFVTTDRLSGIAPGAMSLRNRIGNRVLSLVMRALFGLPIRDSQSGMWAVRREILPPLAVLSDGAAFSQEFKIEAVRRARGRWLEVPIQYSRRSGCAKLGCWRVGFHNAWGLFRKYAADFAASAGQGGGSEQ